MRLGTAVHAYVLEGEDSNDVAVLPDDINRRTKAGKEDYALFCADNADRTILTMDENRKAYSMADSVHACRAASVSLDLASHREYSMRWKCPATGLLARGRPDAYSSVDNIIVDLKTAADASPNGFARSVANYKYHVHAYAYMTGLRELGHVDDECAYLIVAVESTAPYAVGVYSLDRSDIELGGKLYVEAAEKMLECQATDTWPGYSNDEVSLLSLPTWARKNHDRDQED